MIEQLQTKSDVVNRLRRHIFWRCIGLLGGGYALLFLLVLLETQAGLFSAVYRSIKRQLPSPLDELLTIFTWLVLWVGAALAALWPFLIVWYGMGRLARATQVVLEGVRRVYEGEDLSRIEFPEEMAAVKLELSDLIVRQQQEAQAAREAQQAARSAEQRKNDLLVYLAHDLKTPLTSVLGYLSLLREEPDLSPGQRQKFVAIAADKAARLEELINEFFEVTRFNLTEVAYQKAAVNLSLLLQQMEEEFYPIAEEAHLGLQWQVEPGLELTGDAEKLARVFDNILRNAVHFAAPGTAIEVQARRRPGDVLEVRISNAGDEIPAQQLDLIFEKFYRLDPSRSQRGGGAGLGLAIAREIARRHKGDITARSDDAHTVFTVTLPGRPPQTPAASLPLQEPALSPALKQPQPGETPAVRKEEEREQSKT